MNPIVTVRVLTITIVMMAAGLGNAYAQSKTPALAKDQPIEITSDLLDVYQNEHKAIFAGNVIAVQGGTTMRSKTMTVFYRADDKASAPKEATAMPSETTKNAKSSAQGISRIEAEGGVVFTTAEETAQGDKAIYTVDNETIELTGSNVTLTREQNVLKGRRLTYNMATGRSVLTAGNGAEVGDAAPRPTRVHGLFVPKSDPKKAQ